jgi:predicted DCC family thiol-disulfide oxidoreductase YuxK
MILPQDNLILFDGVCNLCTSSVQFIIRRERGAVFRFVSIQSELGREIYRTAGLDPDDFQTLVVLKNGRAIIRSDGALEIASRLDGLWRLLVVFRIVPRAMRDWAYSIIARNATNGLADALRVIFPRTMLRKGSYDRASSCPKLPV